MFIILEYGIFRGIFLEYSIKCKTSCGGVKFNQAFKFMHTAEFALNTHSPYLRADLEMSLFHFILNSPKFLTRARPSIYLFGCECNLNFNAADSTSSLNHKGDALCT